MRRVIKVMPMAQILFLEVDDNELSDLFIKANIGMSGGTSYIERTGFFDIQGVDIICDEEGKLKKLFPSLRLTGDVIAGDCIIVSREIANSEGEQGWFGLS